MDKFIGAMSAIALVSTLFLLMLGSWRRRARRDAHVLGGPLAEVGDVRWTGRVLYVATTRRADSLERLAVPGLAFRGRATLTVGTDAVSIRVDGEREVTLAQAVLRGVGTTSWAIDRGMGTDGLIAIEWCAADAPEDAFQSTFRALSANDHLDALAALRELVTAFPDRSEQS
ncbi:MAG TPA: hypothetical protein VK139_01880 [Microbacteriaceae bacterium]|nr:hypothetical protein [Microbacteriaceae bacterium]